METRELIYRFYHDLWNAQAYDVADQILAADVRFRGSLGTEEVGIPGFVRYAKSVHGGLSRYKCEIKQIVSDAESCAAKMSFTGVHTGEFLGFSPTEKTVSWAGGAFFSISNDRIADIWVLGDLVSLRAQLKSHEC